MELVNLFIGLLTILLLVFVSYQLGIRKGRETADQILGIEHRKALERIKKQAERNQ